MVVGHLKYVEYKNNLVMARYIKPKIKLQNFIKEDLFLKNRNFNNISKKKIKTKKNKFSEKLFTQYYYQLKEKQKVKFIYGILNKQFNNILIRSKNTYKNNSNIICYLEFRLDNIIYKIGFGNTRPQSRQMVLHGFFLINKKKINLPSKILLVGDYIELNKKFKKYILINENLKSYRNTNN